MTDFVHLHLHTEYSLLDGAVKCGELMDHCVKNGIKAVAITDHGNMYATLKFAEEAKKRGVKYIIGCEFYCCQDYTQKDARHSEFDHLILLAKNKAGYKNLVQLDSIAYVDGFYYKPRIDYKTLKEHSEGVICLSACLAGRIPRLLMQGDYEGAKSFALELQSVFGEDFYIEIQDHGIPEQKMTNPLLVQIAREIGAEIVATNDVHYLHQEDWEMQDVLLCIQTKKTLDDPKRMRFQTQEFYMKTGDQMAELFPQWPEAIENTVKIADKIEEEVFPLNVKGYPIRDVSLIPMYSPGDEFRAIPLECLRFFEVEGYETGEYFKKLIANGIVRKASDGSLSSEYEFFTYNSDELAEAFQKTALWLDNKPGYARTLPAQYKSYWSHSGELADYFESLSSVKPKTIGVIKKGTAKAKKVVLDGFIQDVFFLDRDAKPVLCYDNRLQPGVAYPYSQMKEIGYDSKGYLRWLCENGLHKRYKEITETIRKRADYELNIICGMGYADYYLIVWDYINWSKEHGIPVGPGRGSGVSSIVAYSIGITDVEPLQYNLLFERFLNPDRVSMPDFDVDFCTDRRQESIEYVRKKYYSQNVAQIVTFGTMASKGAIKDTGRVMRVPYSETDRVAKLMDGKSSISDLLGRNIEKLEKKIEAEKNEDKRAELMKTLEETKARRNPEFIEVYETDETLRKVIDMALRIEGMP
ncbi:MAG: PHP domain-containing protein, partial [Christensenellaceae bacterium]